MDNLIMENDGYSYLQIEQNKCRNLKGSSFYNVWRVWAKSMPLKSIGDKADI